VGDFALLAPAAGAFAGFVVLLGLCLRALILEQSRRLDEVKAHAETERQLDDQIRLRRDAEAREARATAALERATERMAILEERIAHLEALAGGV
jgi:hypothetical protein